jgi:hypothetical protein
MLDKIAAGVLLGLLCAAGAAAQQPAQQPPRPPAAAPPRITIGTLLNAGFDLKTVLTAQAPCGNQPANRIQMCTHEVYFLQSVQKTIVYRCELGPWNGATVVECLQIR